MTPNTLRQLDELQREQVAAFEQGKFYRADRDPYERRRREILAADQEAEQ